MVITLCTNYLRGSLCSNTHGCMDNVIHDLPSECNPGTPINKGSQLFSLRYQNDSLEVARENEFDNRSSWEQIHHAFVRPLFRSWEHIQYFACMREHIQNTSSWKRIDKLDLVRRCSRCYFPNPDKRSNAVRQQILAAGFPIIPDAQISSCKASILSLI